MTAEIVNLRLRRKAKSRAQADNKAAENRLVFGRPKSEIDRTGQVNSKAKKDLDGHRRED